MTANPIDLVIIDGVPVVKSDVRAYEKMRVAKAVADVSEVRNTDLTGQYGGVYVRSLKAQFDLDAADTTTADDAGVVCIVDNAGNRFKRALASPWAARAGHNVVVNGGMSVSQELGTTGATLASGVAKYILDQFEAAYIHAAGTAVVTSAQLAAASFPAALPGFSFGHWIKATTALSAPANGDLAKHRTKIEGYRIAAWGWGAAGAAGIVVAFDFYSTASGTAFVKLSNSDQSRCYYHEITVAAGWNFYAFTVPGDIAGVWQAAASTGLAFELFVAGKEASPVSALDAWSATNKVQTANSGNLLAANNNQTILTGLYIDVGTQLPQAGDLPALMRPYTAELPICQRYYYKIYNANLIARMFNTGAGTSTVGITFPLPVTMRAFPTVSNFTCDINDTAEFAPGTSIATSPDSVFCQHPIATGAFLDLHGFEASARL